MMPETNVPTVTRRLLLAGAAAGATVTTLPAVSRANEPDPHLAWGREWRTLLDWCNNRPDGQCDRDPVEFPQWHRVSELEELIGTTPARTLAGAVVQLRIVHEWFGSADVLGEDLAAGFENALATVDRLAGECRS